MKLSPLNITLIIVGILLVVWILWSWIPIKNIEEPSYRVVETTSNYEIREYDPMLVISADVEGSLDDSLSAGFRILAGYIFGDNTSKASIDMTTPVTAENETIAMTVPVTVESETIAMTSPVTASGDENRYRVRFVVPKEYTLDTLPTPNDDRVIIEELPARRVAVATYRYWYPTQKQTLRRMEKLLADLNQNEVTIAGNPTFAGYNPPFSFPLLMRTEVQVEVE